MTSTNELDILMSKDPLELSSQDIDAIIEYQRRARRDYESGVKPKKADTQKVDLQKLGFAPKVEAIKRRL